MIVFVLTYFSTSSSSLLQLLNKFWFVPIQTFVFGIISIFMMRLYHCICLEWIVIDQILE